MTNILIVCLLFFTNLPACCQVWHLNYNDTNTIRILNGMQIDNDVKLSIAGSDFFSQLSKEDFFQKYGIHIEKSALIINIESTSIEACIYRKAYSKYPSLQTYFDRLPIVIDGVLVTYSNRVILDNIKDEDIDTVGFVQSSEAIKLFKSVIFGVITVKLKTSINK